MFYWTDASSLPSPLARFRPQPCPGPRAPGRSLPSSPRSRRREASTLYTMIQEAVGRRARRLRDRLSAFRRSIERSSALVVTTT